MTATTVPTHQPVEGPPFAGGFASPDHPTRERVLRDLRAVLGGSGVVAEPAALVAYENDGYMARAKPLAVCLPSTTDQVVSIVRIARQYGLPVTPRGAGTGLSGGATPIHGGLVIGTARMNRVRSIDAPNRRAVVEPGVVNADLGRAVEPLGLFFAPDPSSQAASTIGGNVAENAGGPHCLAYGVTANHILGVEAVLIDGTVIRTGELSTNVNAPDAPGYDLPGILTGSEGTLAFITAVTVRLMTRPEAVRTILALFDSLDAAGSATSAVVGAGIIPAALEFVDGVTIGALRGGGFTEYPEGVEALLLVEVEGLTEASAAEAAAIEAILEASGAKEVRVAASAAERQQLWRGRKGALGALGRLAPNYYIQDGVVPRTRLVEVLGKVQALARRENLLIANVFHAGDGNLHPNILFDARTPGLTARVIAAGEEILRACIDAGGTLSGEHGVGIEKAAYLDWVMTPADRTAQRAIKRTFDDGGWLNPGKP
jgi:glycolate oxidase